jgi:hypothetical protein
MKIKTKRSKKAVLQIIVAGVVCGWIANAVAQPASPFLPPVVVPNTGANLQANVGIDLTRDGAPDLYSTGYFLSNFAVSLNHDGTRIRQGVMPLLALPSYPASQIPIMTGLTSADMDQDAQHLPDLVGITNSGAVFYAANTGSAAMGAGSFAPPTVVDFFGPGAAVNPPFLTYSHPVIRTGDLDGDGRLDLVTSGGRVDMWTGTTFPGELFVYHNQGAGNFTKHTLPLSGSTIDLELGDLNRDGVLDHIVLVTENPAWVMGTYGYELLQAQFNPALPSPLWFSQPAIPMIGRVTALELGDLWGGPQLDYVVSNITYTSTLGTSSIYVYEGDGQGGMVSGSWTTVSLPANTTGLGDLVYSMRVGDFDRDGTDDLAVLRNYTLASSFYSTIPTQYANADVHIGMGPMAAISTMTTIPLGGYVIDGNSAQPAVAQLPLRPLPDALHVYNFGLDKIADLVVAPVASVQTTPTGSVSTMNLVVLRNGTLPIPTEPSVEVYGIPSGGNPSAPAVVGFDGGLPTLGNQAFGITMNNVPAGSLVGFAWGPVGMPNMFTTQEGIEAHIIPVEYSYTYVAQGTGATGGFARQPLAIPSNPSLLGDVGYFQGAYYHSSIGFGGTSGAHVFIGQ